MGMLHSAHQLEARELSPESLALLESVRSDPRSEGLTERRLRRMIDVVRDRLASVTVVLENLYDPHNASAVVRSAEGFGLDAVHVVEQPNRFAPARAIVRGADRWLSVRKHRGLQACVAELVAADFLVCAADVGEGCLPLDAVPVDRPVALVFGSEHDGLSRRAKSLAEARFTIPMCGFTGSFNVSVSAAIALHHISLRRRAFLGTSGDLSPTMQRERVEAWLQKTAKRAPT